MENYKEESLNVQHSKFDYEKEDAYLRAKKKLDKLIAFYWHLAVYVIINVFLIVLIAVIISLSVLSFDTKLSLLYDLSKISAKPPIHLYFFSLFLSKTTFKEYCRAVTFCLPEELTDLLTFIWGTEPVRPYNSKKALVWISESD